MKKICLPALIALSILACTKKNTDKPPVTTSTNITGTWVVNADTLRMIQNGVLKETDAFTGNPLQLFNYRFDADGTVIYISQSDTTQKASGTYSVKNNIITFFHPAQPDEEAYSQNATIKQHTSNSLVIYFDDTSTSGTITEEDTEVVYMTK
jgi:hypothetical protein